MLRTVQEVEQFIYSSYVKRYKEIPGGDDSGVRSPHLTRRMLDEMGGKDRFMNNIMITGSKGKGSLSLMLAKILEGQGCRVGLFTSPHLRDYRERIRVNGQAISEEALLEIANELEPRYRAIEGELPPHRYIGPVGATAVLAMSYFHQMHTDFNVVECGRGARYDDVNQIRGMMAGINKIFLEHAGPLGYTLDDVAHHKAGIIKSGMKGVYTAAQSKYPELVLRYEARKFEIPVYQYNNDFVAYDIQLGKDGTSFSVRTELGDYRDLRIPLLGQHQAENAALAVAMAEGAIGESLIPEKVREALRDLHWPGRMEILAEEPLVILDGCISVPSMKEVDRILSFLPRKKVVSVVAIPEDKDYLGVLELVKEYAGPVILTHADNDYLKFSEKQVEEAGKILPVEFYPRVAEAMDRARSLAGEEDLILCLGTQSFIKDMKIYYQQDTLNI